MLRAIGLALVLTLTACIPTAASQVEPPDVRAEMKVPIEERLMPDSGLWRIPIIVDVECTGEENAGESTSLEFSIKGPTYAVLLLEQTKVVKSYQPNACPLGQMDRFTNRLSVSTTRDAPAMENGVYELEVTVKKKTTGTGQAVKVMAQIQNDFFPLTVVNAHALFIKAGQNSKAVFPVDVMNLGNGPVAVDLELIPTSRLKFQSLNAGQALKLDSKIVHPNGANKATRNVEAITPLSSGVASFVVKFSTKYDGTVTGPTWTDEATITFSVQVGGDASEAFAPGPGPLWLILIGAAAAGVLRRRHT